MSVEQPQSAPKSLEEKNDVVKTIEEQNDQVEQNLPEKDDLIQQPSKTNDLEKSEYTTEKPFITPTSSTENAHTLENSKQKDLKKDVTILPTNTKGLHTVFIHKLYNMLEDDDLKHLIWWSATNESFMITPGEEFSKALAQYFKHTNVASFVRQLNMYGFHKVSDGTTTDNSEVTTWEFRHSSGSFRKGDIDSLKSIKRRSSKHASSKTNSNADLSDNEGVVSERSNSVTDAQIDSSVDPVLNVRLAELGHNLAALRHEHARLQLRYDTAIEDLRKTNLDMVHLLDLVQKLVRSSTVDGDSTKDTQIPNHNIQQQQQNASPLPQQVRRIEEENLPSPGSAPKEQSSTYSAVEIESDIARFRASIIQRAASRDTDQFSVSFAPSYQLNSRTSQVQVQPQPQQPPSQIHPNSSNISTPEAYPYPYPYPYPQQQQQYPQQVQVHQQQQQQQQVFQHLHPGQQPVPGHVIVHDPFHSDRKTSSSSSRSRNMSILYDPLAPPGTTGHMISPASQTSINRSSISAVVSNSDTNITSPTAGQNSYFPDYGTYQRSHSPHQVTRDQRSGSFPGLAPNIQNSIRGEGLMRKRHSSNDAGDYAKSQEFSFNNPPRSIPVARQDEEFQGVREPRKSLSATNITSLKSSRSQENLKNYTEDSSSTFGKYSQHIQPGPPLAQQTPQLQQQQLQPGSGVYALLNPSEHARRDSVAGRGPPPPKKTRNA